VSVIVICPDCSAEFYEDFLEAEGLDSCESCGASLHQAEEELEADRYAPPDHPTTREAEYLGRMMAHAYADYLVDAHKTPIITGAKQHFIRHEKGRPGLDEAYPKVNKY